jgi:7-cyano-7-deazaguanine synthase
MVDTGTSQKKAVILLSGGLDSATVAAQSIADGYEAIALSFRYGQRHERELLAARQVAAALDIREHFIVDVLGCKFPAATAGMPSLLSSHIALKFFTAFFSGFFFL